MSIKLQRKEVSLCAISVGFALCFRLLLLFVQISFQMNPMISVKPNLRRQRQIFPKSKGSFHVVPLRYALLLLLLALSSRFPLDPPGDVWTCSQLPGWWLLPCYPDTNTYQQECAQLTLVLFLSVGPISTTEPSIQLDLESGTICWQTSDSRTCDAAISDGRWRHFYLVTVSKA